MFQSWFKKLSIESLRIWVSLFALIPFMLIIIVSFLNFDPDNFFQWKISLNNYQIIKDPLFLKILFRSFFLAGLVTLICLVIGYPFAFLLSRMQGQKKIILMLLIIVPFWTSSLIRTYAIMAIIKAHGLLNSLLLSLGLIQTPLLLLYTQTAVLIGLTYSLLPFMILPLYSNMEKFDNNLFDAAKDLGASTWIMFTRILLPQTWPGIAGGCILVMLPAMTLFYIPDILGGAKSLLLGNLIKNQFLEAGNWPVGSAVSVILTVLMGLLIFIYWHMSCSEKRDNLL